MKKLKNILKNFYFISFYETSAKTGFNAKKVFINAAINLYEIYIKYNKSNNLSGNENKKTKFRK